MNTLDNMSISIKKIVRNSFIVTSAAVASFTCSNYKYASKKASIITEVRNKPMRANDYRFWENTIYAINNKGKQPVQMGPYTHAYPAFELANSDKHLTKFEKLIKSNEFQDFLLSQSKEKKDFIKKHPNYIVIETKKTPIRNSAYKLINNISEFKSHHENKNRTPYTVIEYTHFNRRIKYYQDYKGNKACVVSDRKVEIKHPYDDIHAFYSIEEDSGQKYMVCTYYGKKKNTDIVAEEYIEYAHRYGYSRTKPL